MGIPMGFPMGIPMGMGMGIEIASPRQPWVLLRTVYSQAQGCVWACCMRFSCMGGDVEQHRLMSNYDVIHKTGST